MSLHDKSHKKMIKNYYLMIVISSSNMLGYFNTHLPSFNGKHLFKIQGFLQPTKVGRNQANTSSFCPVAFICYFFPPTCNSMFITVPTTHTVKYTTRSLLKKASLSQPRRISKALAFISSLHSPCEMEIIQAGKPGLQHTSRTKHP